MTEERIVIGVEDWAEIRRLPEAGQMPIMPIARTLKISRNTVRERCAALMWESC